MRLKALARSRLAQSIAALSGVQAAYSITPLVTVPYLTRTLGVTEWGRVALAQAIGLNIALIVEYGFLLSATREIARHRDNPQERARILASVLGAKLLLAAGATAVALALRPWLPGVRDNLPLFVGGVAWGLATALGMLWYFQGIERVRVIALVTVGCSVLGVAMLPVLVRHHGDGWKAMAVLASASGAAAVIGAWLAYRDTAFARPTLQGSIDGLRAGWSLFLFRAAVMLYTSANTTILGFFAAPRIVGYYAGAEKIMRGLVNLIGPVTQTFFARLSHLAANMRTEAPRIARLGLRVTMSWGALLSLGAVVLAGPTTRIVLGHGFGPSVAVMRILAPLPLLVALSNVIGIQWMLPLGMDSTLRKIILTAGIFNVALAVSLAPHLAARGMAIAAVSAEVIVTVGCLLAIRGRRGELWGTDVAASPATGGTVG